MKKIFNRMIAGLFVVSSVLAVGAFSGCASTWEGMGKDIEQIGKDIQS